MQMDMVQSVFGAVFSNQYLSSVIFIGIYMTLLALGVLVGRRAGIFFLAIEGVMSVSATAGYYFDGFLRAKLLAGAAEGSAAYEAVLGKANTLGWLGGVVAGLLAGMLFTLLFCALLLYSKANELILGFVMNTLAFAVSGFVFNLADRADNTGFVLPAPLPSISVPAIQQIPVLGGLFGTISWGLFFAIAAPFAVFYLLNKTDFGLRMRAAQENHAALIDAGIPVEKLQLQGMMLAGVLASLGGIVIALAGDVKGFTIMPRGEGYLALVAVWASAGRMGKSMLAVLLLALVGALSPVLSGVLHQTPLLQALLYLAGLGGLLLHSYNERNRHRARLRFQRLLLSGEEAAEKRRLRWHKKKK